MNSLARSRAVVLAALAAVVLVGCRGAVTVSVTGDGSTGGTVSVEVELDEELLEALGGPEAIVLDDVGDSGWSLGEPEATTGGGLRLVAAHDYADAGELQVLLDSIAGPGVFSEVRASAEESFAAQRSELGLQVTVNGELGQFSDAALTELLGGLPLGYTPEELAFMGADRPDAATMVVEVSVPGGEVDSAELTLTSGEEQSASLSSVGEDSGTTAWVLVGAAALLALGAVVLGLVSFRS